MPQDLLQAPSQTSVYGREPRLQLPAQAPAAPLQQPAFPPLLRRLDRRAGPPAAADGVKYGFISALPSAPWLPSPTAGAAGMLHQCPPAPPWQQQQPPTPGGASRDWQQREAGEPVLHAAVPQFMGHPPVGARFGTRPAGALLPQLARQHDTADGRSWSQSSGTGDLDACCGLVCRLLTPAMGLDSKPHTGF